MSVVKYILSLDFYSSAFISHILVGQRKFKGKQTMDLLQLQNGSVCDWCVRDPTLRLLQGKRLHYLVLYVLVEHEELIYLKMRQFFVSETQAHMQYKLFRQ